MPGLSISIRSSMWRPADNDYSTRSVQQQGVRVDEFLRCRRHDKGVVHNRITTHPSESSGSYG